MLFYNCMLGCAVGKTKECQNPQKQAVDQAMTPAYRK